MNTLAAIVAEYGEAYQATYGARLLPSHRRTLRDMVTCRTATLGGHVYYCDQCEVTHYQYHSCRNRHCPQCQYQQGQAWLERQSGALLPVPYFMVTFTLPSALHDLARSQQKALYHILFRASAEALQQLARDPRYVGGQIGMMGVLHTWGRMLNYHPHVHYLVPAGGLSADRSQWLAARCTFLVPVKALSVIFRAKFRDALKETPWFDEIPPEVWQQDWVVHCQPVGQGQAALRYLAPYIFRVAISNRRIVKVAEGQVSFRYRPSGSNRWKICTLPVEEFLRRFLQHVLPKGFVKVRYYGFLSHSHRHRLPDIWALLEAEVDRRTILDSKPAGVVPATPVLCPTCGKAMRHVQHLHPHSRGSPMPANTGLDKIA